MTITRREVTIGIFGIIIGVLGMVSYGLTHTRELERTLTSERMMSEAAFVVLAEQADRIEVIPESTASVRDCDHRARYEELLSRLPTLLRAERSELDVLFASCGDYHARLKAYYADRLNSSALGYAVLRAHHDIVFSSRPEQRNAEIAMFALARTERSRADDLYMLVRLQQEMNDVYAGRATRSLDEVMQDARAVEKRLSENDAAADAVRDDINHK